MNFIYYFIYLFMNFTPKPKPSLNENLLKKNKVFLERRRIKEKAKTKSVSILKTDSKKNTKSKLTTIVYLIIHLL